jgi:uncharacterized protein (DUF952 family)
MNIFHIAIPEDWENANDETYYYAKSLQTEGFIHCSFSDQLEGVIDRYYRGFGRVLILRIETEHLDAPLVVEPSTGREPYPHIYGPLLRSAVAEVIERQV